MRVEDEREEGNDDDTALTCFSRRHKALAATSKQMSANHKLKATLENGSVTTVTASGQLKLLHVL